MIYGGGAEDKEDCYDSRCETTGILKKYLVRTVDVDLIMMHNLSIFFP